MHEKALLRVLGSLALCSLVTLTPTPTPARTFTFINKCTETIWLAQGGNSTGGWQLDVPPSSCASNTDCPQSQTCNNNQCEFTLNVPDTFSGRFWPRTGCAFNTSGVCDPNVNCCATGGCSITGGWGLECQSGGQSPVTVAEFTLSQTSTDFYDVSVIDGFNVAVEVQQTGGSSTCPLNPSDCGYWCGNPGGPTSTTNLAGCTWNQVLDSTCDSNPSLRVVAPSSCTSNADCQPPSTCNLGTNVCQCTSDSGCNAAKGEICGVGNNQIIGYLACGQFVGCTTPKALCGIGAYFNHGKGGSPCTVGSDCASNTCISGTCTVSPADPFDCNKEYARTVSCNTDTDCPQLIGINCTIDSDCPTFTNSNRQQQNMKCVGATDQNPGKCQEPCISGQCAGVHCKSDSDCVNKTQGTFMLCDKSGWNSPTSQTCVATNASLFECTGVSGSCYTSGVSSLCAGCPTDSSNPLSKSWPASPTQCSSNNTDWTGAIQPWLISFKKACPTAYSFPFDDPTSTFQCKSDGTTNSVNYTITFCPK